MPSGYGYSKQQCSWPSKPVKLLLSKLLPPSKSYLNHYCSKEILLASLQPHHGIQNLNRNVSSESEKLTSTVNQDLHNFLIWDQTYQILNNKGKLNVQLRIKANFLNWNIVIFILFKLKGIGNTLQIGNFGVYLLII